MNRLTLETNAVISIAARDIIHSVRSPVLLALSLFMPVIFMGILGGSMAQNLGAGAGFDLLQFILFGMVVSTLYQVTMGSLVSLIEDRETDFRLTRKFRDPG
jgi:ABC-2 type transport system permease protein